MFEASTPHPRDAAPLEAFQAALDWWREAGVDYAFADGASGWLAEPEVVESTLAPPPPPPATPPRRSAIERALAAPLDVAHIGGPRDRWPGTLAAFTDWWLAEPSFADVVSTRRLPPRGKAGARLMVLVDHPAADDGEQLLSGNAGKLLTAMLGAMAIPADDVYFASVLPAPTALPEWNALSERGLGDVTRHHITLAAPRRVLVLGRALAPLFGIAAENAREPVTLGSGGKDVPLLLAADLAQLARFPARRRNFWIRWLEWTR